MPLFILSLDDYKRNSALEIAIMQKKPATFEMMVAMLRDFQDICSSKMMLSNFKNMISVEALDYFDKSQFNPPLLQVPFVVDWPDVNEIVFTSDTSLVNEKMITEQINKYHRSKIGCCFRCFNRIIDCFSRCASWGSKIVRRKKKDHDFELDLQEL